MCNISIIKAEEKYIYEYWKIFDEIARERKYLASTKAFSLESTRIFIQDSIRRGYPYYFAINSEDKLVGWCDIQPKDNMDYGTLGVALKSGYRDRGIGRKLIKETLEAAKEYGFTHIELDVREFNKRAIHLYIQMGFKVVNVEEKGIFIGAEPEDVIKMRIKL